MTLEEIRAKIAERIGSAPLPWKFVNRNEAKRIDDANGNFIAELPNDCTNAQFDTLDMEYLAWAASILPRLLEAVEAAIGVKESTMGLSWEVDQRLDAALASIEAFREGFNK
jgi:hypothetical protein